MIRSKRTIRFVFRNITPLTSQFSNLKRSLRFADGRSGRFDDSFIVFTFVVTCGETGFQTHSLYKKNSQESIFSVTNLQILLFKIWLSWTPFLVVLRLKIWLKVSETYSVVYLSGLALWLSVSKNHVRLLLGLINRFLDFLFRASAAGAAERARVLEEFWNRKRDAQRNRARGQVWLSYTFSLAVC